MVGIADEIAGGIVPGKTAADDIANGVVVSSIGATKTSMAALIGLTKGTYNIMPEDEFEKIIFRGNYMGITNPAFSSHKWYDLANYLIEARYSGSWEAITQIVMTFEDPGLEFYEKGVFQQGGEVFYRNTGFIISGSTVNEGGSSNGGVVVTLRNAAVQALKDRKGNKVMTNASAADFVAAECKAVGVNYVVQTSTPKRSVVARDVPKSSEDKTIDSAPSSWTTFQRLAREEGYAIFEAYNVIYFIKPSKLFELAYLAGALRTIRWDQEVLSKAKSIKVKTSDVSRVFQQYTTTSYKKGNNLAKLFPSLYGKKHYEWEYALAVPNCEWASDRSTASVLTVTLEVPQSSAQYYRIGQPLRVEGVSSEISNAPLLISGIEYDLAGVDNCRLTAESPIDPKASGYKNTNPNSGSNRSTTNAVLPKGVYAGQHLSPTQANNATLIYQTTMAFKGMNERDAEVALITAAVESNFHRYTNPVIPKSRDVPNDGPPPGGGDHDSIGLFQQRTSWGSVAERMDAIQSTKLFLRRLKNVPNRHQRPQGQVAQAVQVSAFPDRYQQRLGLAKAIIKGLRASVGSSGNHNGIAGSIGGGVGSSGPYHGRIATKSAYDMVTAALSQAGKRYVFGAHPSSLKEPLAVYDCSLLVQWACYQVGVYYPRDTYSQWSYIRNKNSSIDLRRHYIIGVAQARKIRGAVLFPKDLHHTGISLGNGKTIEAMDESLGVRKGSAYSSQWGLGVLIPGLHY